MVFFILGPPPIFYEKSPKTEKHGQMEVAWAWVLAATSWTFGHGVESGTRKTTIEFETNTVTHITENSEQATGEPILKTTSLIRFLQAKREQRGVDENARRERERDGGRAE